MKRLTLFAAVVVAMALSSETICSAATFSDGFESYNLGALDKNLSGGPNAAPNGAGNPWFGPAPPNGQVVGIDNGVSPFSGNQMLRGANVSGADLDQNWYNLAYRLNGGAPYTGGISLQWYFYDPWGPGGTNFRDYAALGFYNTAPSATDYPGTGSLNSSTQIQRLSLGAPYNASAGFDSSKYQARVIGATDGYSGTSYFNTNTTRTMGWHQGRIVVGSALADGTNTVDFYIDGVLTFSHNSMTTYGYNIIELDTKFGSQTGYFDDVSFTDVPEPATVTLLALGGLGLLRRKRN
ncbi:MAG: PEP-CTERM sorting domain-containing protein [Planctomycetaceae bacterium]|nr:PEP-CTERM sorting domain-containing protein [Planctomycetaceae bacterium]